MNQNKKILIIGGLFAMVVVGSFALYKANNNKPTDVTVNQSYEYVDTRQPTDVNQNLSMITPDNKVLAGTDWFDSKNAPLVFVDGEHWVWYKETEMNSENAISGTYETYFGKTAFEALDQELFTGEEGKPEASNDSIVLKLNILSIKENGNDILNKANILTLMGTKTESNLNLIDVYNLNKYDFTAEQNVDIGQADMEANKILEDITYTENMEAWKTFDLKVNGKNLSYPYSSMALKEAGLSYPEPNENNGLTTFTLNGNYVGEGIFINKTVDSLSYLTLQQANGLEVTLTNGITWGDGEEKILKAYGEPSEIVRGSSNEKIYRYNNNKMQMELYVYTEDCDYGTNLGLTKISINDFIN